MCTQDGYEWYDSLPDKMERIKAHMNTWEPVENFEDPSVVQDNHTRQTAH